MNKAVLALLILASLHSFGQPVDAYRAINLHADDTAAFKQVPENYNKYRKSIARGHLDTLTYKSTA